MKSNLRKLSAAWPLVIFLLFPALTRGETAIQAWVQRYNGQGNGDSEAAAVAVDGSNNVIVTGSSWDGTSSAYATIKYSSAGVPLWTNLYYGPGSRGSSANAVALDGSNNVIVTGESSGSGGYGDYATIKYSSAGVPLWTNRYPTPGNGSISAVAVAVDGTNDVIVTGNYHCATIKYSSAGVPLWTNLYYGSANWYDAARAVVADHSNNVILAGFSSESGSSADCATIKYSSAGELLWVSHYNGPGNGFDQVAAVAVDGSNNVIVTGYTSGGAGVYDYDYVTIKYSSEGEQLWINRYNGPANGPDYATAVAADRSNNVIVTGSSARGDSGYDYATIKYSIAGVPLWTNRYEAKELYRAAALAVDGNDNVIVTGPAMNSANSGFDYATVKYSSAGLPLWTSRYSTPGNGRAWAQAVAVDRSNNVIVTGYATASGGDNEFATIKYGFPLVITGFKPTDGTFQMLLDNLQPSPVVIKAATNLAGWAPVFTNTTPTNVLFYTDPEASNSPTRFYRAFQFP